MAPQGWRITLWGELNSPENNWVVGYILNGYTTKEWKFISPRFRHSRCKSIFLFPIKKKRIRSKKTNLDLTHGRHQLCLCNKDPISLLLCAWPRWFELCSQIGCKSNPEYITRTTYLTHVSCSMCQLFQSLLRMFTNNNNNISPHHLCAFKNKISFTVPDNRVLSWQPCWRYKTKQTCKNKIDFSTEIILFCSSNMAAMKTLYGTLLYSFATPPTPTVF